MNRRIGAIVLLSVASIALLVALVTRGWFRDSVDVAGLSNSYGVGLWGNGEVTACGDAVEKQHGKRCVSATKTISWDSLSGTKDKAWLLFGRLTMVIGLMTLLVLAGSIALLAKRHELTKYAWLAGVAGVGATMLTAILYLALQPDSAGTLGYSVFLFFPAAVGAGFGALISRDALSVRENKPLPGIGIS